MIRKVVVPNRGEIAVRIARTCREMGIGSVLAHSEIDRASFASRAFDETVSLGSGDSRSTYLNVARIIDACREVGADAIHPGYGFLSERAELAAACAEAGITFIGPSAEAIELMGSKSDSRERMVRAGVPVVPGYHGEEQSDERLVAEGKAIGFPLLVKASAGGGGKGMKIVSTEGDLLAAVHAARREASKAFGNDRLLLEKYLHDPRHVEFQVFGDHHGTLLHMFERDCSIQRRHQKIIEESPAPNYGNDLRRRMAEAAVAAAAAVRYRNAGTVEFIVTPEGHFYFLEMNTRLQVEHPVTELVLGLDLVRTQIEVARGERLRWRQEELRQHGHAIECRIYAEDPDGGFLPQTGTIRRYDEPGGPGTRVDSGVAAGSEVTVNYDPLLAKLVTWANDRDAAIDRMIRALSEYVILGVTTNISYLRRLLLHPDFRRGEVATSFIPRREAALARSVSSPAVAVAAVIAARGRAKSRLSAVPALARASVWELVGAWER